jgi:aspartate-semialdehyde dehydrogenase
MKVAVVGATGLVGNVMLRLLEERNFPVTELIPVASEKSVGKKIKFKEKEYSIVSMKDAIAAKPSVALFSAGGETSKLYAPDFAEVGTFVIDNSSAWRMDIDKKLIVPEINAHTIEAKDKIIANPNCSTIQMVLVLGPLHSHYKIKRLVISTYQSVTGTGVKAVQQLENERNGIFDQPKAYPHNIDKNCIPQCDVFTDNDYTKEEMKMVNETRKILNDSSIAITATCVRVPVMGGHSESVNIEFENAFDVEDIQKILRKSPGVIVEDEPAISKYPMPSISHNRDEVFVGRIRRDHSINNGLNLWIVADNLRKGAATNAIQIAESLLQRGLIG